jgi:hypothetical protein
MAFERTVPGTGTTATSAITLTLGAAVFTTDNDKLGTVKEIRSDAFKVDASMQPDYWLSLAAVASAGVDRVLLTFSKDRLGEMKLDGDTYR